MRTGLVVALAFASLAAPVQVLVGDWAGREVAKRQPTKLAAFEGLQETTAGAPFTLGGWYSYSAGEVKYGLRIPNMLSLLAKHNPTATIQGLDAVPPRDRPPVNVVRVAFQSMAGIGTMLALLGVWFLVGWWRGGLPGTKWFYRAVIVAGPLAYVALICGWVTTEVGRQPWIVYRVMRTTEAVTNARGLAVGYVVLLAVYAFLAGAVFWLLRRLSRRPEAVGG